MGHEQDHNLDCTTNHTACTDCTDFDASADGHGLMPKTDKIKLDATEAGAQVNYPYICLQDQKAQNTSGGTFTSGAWRTRDLTTEQSDAGAHCSLAANQFTLDAGDYVILAFAPAMGVNNHQARLYNVTDTAVLITGQCAWNVGGPYAMTNSVIMGRFTIAASKALEIQHRCATTVATIGFGTQFNQTTEIFTTVQLWKVA